MGSVGGVPPSGSKTITNFDKVSQDLIKKGEDLQGQAEVALQKATDELKSSGDRAGEAGMNLVEAVGNAGLAGAFSLKAGAEGVVATGHGVAGAGVVAAGVVVGAGEESLSFTSRALNACAKAFIAISNTLSRFIGDGNTATVKEIEGQGKGRLSEKLFGVAGQQFQMSAEGYKAAWGSFEQSVMHALDAGVNVTFAAGYTALAAADLVQAAGRTGQAGVLASGDLLLCTAALGVQAAENGVQGARDLTILGAKLTAAMGRLAASPADADTVQIEVKQAQEAYDAKFRELMQNNPRLRELPAAKDYMALQGAG